MIKTAVATDDIDELAKRMRLAWLDVPYKCGTNRRWEDCDPAIHACWRRVAAATLAYLQGDDDG